MKQIRYLVTPEEVGDEEYLEAWKARFEATRGSVGSALRGQLEKRRQRLAAGEGADDDGGGGQSSA